MYLEYDWGRGQNATLPTYLETYYIDPYVTCMDKKLERNSAGSVFVLFFTKQESTRGRAAGFDTYLLASLSEKQKAKFCTYPCSKRERQQDFTYSHIPRFWQIHCAGCYIYLGSKRYTVIDVHIKALRDKCGRVLNIPKYIGKSVTHYWLHGIHKVGYYTYQGTESGRGWGATHT